MRNAKTKNRVRKPGEDALNVLLASHIGWPSGSIHLTKQWGVFVHDTATGFWQIFDFNFDSVIWKIAERFDCFPRREFDYTNQAGEDIYLWKVPVPEEHRRNKELRQAWEDAHISSSEGPKLAVCSAVILLQTILHKQNHE